ncbi:hypothetical protein MSTE_03591 [Mycobacteroides stephanolepidis]|uniref:Uncharacterized protein n=1 Tax=[Mycobacterium] stephanolepidis TaxID=1520670 RepID=A0A1Z4F101_9MYCO|nr:hypothetical protein [[Mycobacterium] stephanolepidis]BAX98891.1 hypothetical protein MSTE_03591 [[Mycobacterium] stephanolepidis]
MTDYQRNRQAEQLHGVDKIRDYLHDIDLEVLNELIEDEDGAAPEDDQPSTHHHADTAPEREPNAYELAILGALQNKSVYLGSVPADEVRRRRLRNRDSKRARRLQRRSKVRRMKRRHQTRDAAA